MGTEYRKRRNYDKAFKEESLRLVLSGRPVREVADSLDVPIPTLGRWVREYEQDPSEAFPGKGNLKPSDAELQKILRENEQLKRDRDILKKALAIFSKAPQ
jgi:transposase